MSNRGKRRLFFTAQAIHACFSSNLTFLKFNLFRSASGNYLLVVGKTSKMIDRPLSSMAWFAGNGLPARSARPSSGPE